MEGEELDSPRELTPEAELTLEKVHAAIFNRQAHQCLLDYLFNFSCIGKVATPPWGDLSKRHESLQEGSLLNHGVGVRQQPTI